MDRANYALASYLARHGFETHLVAHRVSPSLAEQPQLVVHRVPKPANSYTLAQPLLDWYGRFWARRIAARGGRVVVNGGNCRWYDVNWTQHVNSAWQPKTQAGLLRRLKLRLDQQTAPRCSSIATTAASPCAWRPRPAWCCSKLKRPAARLTAARRSAQVKQLHKRPHGPDVILSEVCGAKNLRAAAQAGQRERDAGMPGALFLPPARLRERACPEPVEGASGAAVALLWRNRRTARE